MKTYEEARAALTAILVEECSVDASSISDTARLQDDLGLDSMTLLSLALEVENFLGCALEEDPENPPLTVGELFELVVERLEEQSNVA
ncbi:MAG: acyl carrier protein [Myxococcota bacterium]